MQINLIADNSVASAPAGFVAMVQAAAAIYEQAFSGNYTVNITYGWGTLDNQVSPDLTNPNSGIFSLGGFNNSTDIDYATMKSWFGANAAIASLPASYTGLPNYASLPGNPNSYLVTSAQEKALGVFFGDASSVDGSIGFNTGDLSVEPVADWEQAALQEIGHALGWNTGYVISEGDVPSVLDLFRYGSAGNLQWTDGQPAYFSLNGGGTDVANYLTVGDYTLFSNAGDVLGDNDPFALPQTGNPATATLTSLDTEIFNILGFASADSATADMILRDGNNGDYEIYDLGGNGILAAAPLGQVGLEWKVVGVGAFDAPDTSDMILRNSNTGQFEIYDVSNNNLTGAAPMGQVGLEWAVSGFGDFSSRSGETDMLMRDGNNGNFEIYDLANNTITFAAPMGQVGQEWSVAGFGDFSTRPNETDMLMRNSNTGQFEIYDISNNAITSAAPMGQVGLEWSVAGFAEFSTRLNETDMLMRNNNTGQFEIYDISNNQITSAAPMGQVGLEWSVAGFGSINGAGTGDMLMRNSDTGQFEIYDISNNAITSAASMGQVGLEWSVAGIAADPPSSPPAAQLSGMAVDPAGAASSSATAQLTQAMASFAPSGGGSDASSQFAQVSASDVSNTTGLLSTTNQPQAIS